MFKTTLAAVLLAVTATCPAWADLASAKACNGDLSPLGQEIFVATLKQKPTAETAPTIIKAEVKQLVASGQTTLKEGLAAAQAAGDCLKMLN